jgi:hypothetical protein
MPLVRNGEPYKLTEEDKKRIRNLVGNKFPVKFKMVPELYKPDPINKGRIIRPPGVNITTKSVVSEDGEYVTWMYGRTFKKDKNNKMTSSDGMISFETELSVGANQMDWLYFLLFCCPILKGSKHATPNTRTMFMLEDIEKESMDIVNREKDQSAAIYFITGGEWSEVKIRKVAAAMNIPHAMDSGLIGISQLQATLVALVKKDKGLKEFMALTKSSEEIEIRAKIREFEDLNLIKFTDSSWYFLAMNTEKSQYEVAAKICDIAAGKSALDSLIYLLKTDKNKWEQFRAYNKEEEEELVSKPKASTKR